MKYFWIFGVASVLLSLASTKQPSAEEIVNKTIKKSGGDLYEHAIVHFTFRDKIYRSERRGGVYQLERFVYKTDQETHDVVSNKGLVRTINSCPVKVVDSMITRISDGVNSVHYFANLPYGLNAPAVHKKLIGETVINKEPYYKVSVYFDQEGGGTDYEDEFLYWIHKDKFTVDFLAYKYAVDGGGIRFREAYNNRQVNGIRFVDYNNYKTDDMKTPLTSLDKMFEANKLKLLSKIELEDIAVYILPDA